MKKIALAGLLAVSLFVPGVAHAGETATFRFSISVRTPNPAHVRVHWRESCMLDGIGWIERGEFFDRSPLLRRVGRPEIANWCHLTAWVRNLDHPRQTPRVVVRVEKS